MPTFMLGEKRQVLHSVSYSLLVFLLLFFLSPFSNAENLYNDKGNDSCLTIYSDNSVYRPNDLSKPKTINVFLTIVNDCGLPITANLGLSTEIKHTGLIGISSIEVTKGTKLGAIAKPTANVLPFVSIKKSFETKTGWESVVLQDGNTEIKMELTIPLEDGEFAITVFNPLKPEQQSILDPFYSGNGSAGSPYQIRTCVQLQDMNSYLNDSGVYFELGSDIDCSGTLTWASANGLGLNPIGTLAAPFKGIFDGNNFLISNLMVYDNVGGYAGLFGATTGARIRNVGLIDFNVYSTISNVGALIGQGTETDVNNVWVFGGTVTGLDGRLGGLIGSAGTSDLNQVFVKDTEIRSWVSVTSVGGITGGLDGTGSIWHGYSTAKISSIGGGGGMASNDATGTITQSYWNITDCNIADNSKGTIVTQLNQFKQATYVAWDFTNIWNIAEDENTPYFLASDYIFGGASTYSIPDLNFVSLEGDLFVAPVKTYAYTIDGNLTIDFNVFDANNNRLLLDLNYGNPSASIVKDLNLTSDVCPDQNWSDAPSLCHWDFNISSSLVSDGNYFLKAYLRTPLVTSTTQSDTNFSIANDVNLIVNVPIDEETGQPINTTNLYRWTVRIYDSDGLHYYPDQKDLNGFVVPIGETIIVTIDTNESTAYYARQYSLLFSEATATYTLQPYLIKQSVSGNFIFNVVNVSTLAPISGVEIKVYGFVPNLNEPNLQTITTDAAGLATIPLRLNSPYTVKFYYLNALVHTANITPTTASLYYQVQLNIAGAITTTPDYGGIQASFSPTTGYLLQKSNGSIDINVSFTMLVKTLQTMTIQVFDTNGCRFDLNTFTGPWTDGNSIRFPSIDLNSGSTTSIHTGFDCNFDDMYSIYVRIDANSTDGNQYQAYSIKWQLVTENNYKYNLLYLLPNLATNINGSNGKLATTFLAFLVLITAISAVGAATGGEPIMAAMLTLSILGFFVLIGFVDVIPFAFICIATFFSIVFIWRRFG